MKQVHTGVSLKALRIEQLQARIAQLQSEVVTAPCAAMMFDTVILKLNLKNDAALARRVSINAATICNIRHDKLPVTANLLIRLHEESDLPIKDLKALAGI